MNRRQFLSACGLTMAIPALPVPRETLLHWTDGLVGYASAMSTSAIQISRVAFRKLADTGKISRYVNYYIS